MRHVCPFCGCKKFFVTVQVEHECAVDAHEDSPRIMSYGEPSDVYRAILKSTRWKCVHCGKRLPEGQPFYFTFGADPAYPYQETYLVVFANDQNEAIEKFREKYPDRPGRKGIYNAAFSYSDKEWKGSLNERSYGLPAEVIV